MTYHSITCLPDCDGWPCDCPCGHRECDQYAGPTDTIGAQDNSGPRPAFAPPTEDLTTKADKES